MVTPKAQGSPQRKVGRYVGTRPNNMTNDGLNPPPSFLIAVIYCGAAKGLISHVWGDHKGRRRR